MAAGLGVHDQRRQSGEALPGSQMVWRHLHHPLVCWHSLPPQQPPPSPRTHPSTNPPSMTSDGSNNNLKSPNLQLDLTPAQLNVQLGVGEQSGMGGAAAIKKCFNFRHTEVQFCHACESDNYPRSTEILQINQWAAFLIPSGRSQIKCIIDPCNPCICNYSPGWGVRGGGGSACTEPALSSSSLVFSFTRFLPTWLVCCLGWLGGGGVRGQDAVVYQCKGGFGSGFF